MNADIQLPVVETIPVRLGTRAYAPDQPPAGICRLEEPAIWVSQGIGTQVLWSSAAEPFCEAPRAVKTGEGDLLVIFPVGTAHTWGKLEKVNRMVALRSADGGRTWSAPVEPWQVPYNQHAWNPLSPRGSSRIYSAAMEAPFEELEQPHNGPVGLRSSDDGGRTWSGPMRIRPVNDPDYKGVCHMQWCELATGTWLLGTYTIQVSDGQRTDTQYVLRSEDQGQSWELLPGARPHGLNSPGQRRVLEGEVVDLGNGSAAIYTRSQTGRVWVSRSADDGRTWSATAPTELVHPDAPPMIFTLDAPGHLLALTHRAKASDPDWNHRFPDRQSLWCQVSHDSGTTWSEPRFLVADVAPYGGLDNAWVEVGYADVVVDGDELHIFLDYKKAVMLHLRLRLDELSSLPGEQELSAGTAASADDSSTR